MKQIPRYPCRRFLRSGMTLIELTLVLLILLAFVGILGFSARGWKTGTDRARCIMNIRQMQMSVRAYGSASSVNPGTDLSMAVPPVNVLAELAGPGRYVPELPTCPGNGFYYFGGDVVPQIGELYMTCSLASSASHVPKEYGNW